MDKLHLFKIGGKVIDKPAALESFLEGFAAIQGPKVLVHGGGVIADQLAAKLEVETRMIDGRRVTSSAMRDVATMVYGGLINKNIVAALQKKGCDAIGLTGADAGLIEARKREAQPIDYGYVGDVQDVKAGKIQGLIELGLTPVFAPLSCSPALGEILNTNADSITSALARGLSARYEVHMLYGFEHTGVMRDLKDPASLITKLDAELYRGLKETGVIAAGMLPKLEECFKALAQGTKHVLIAEAPACLAYARGDSYRGTAVAL